eukprot:TRINITY_DN11601_c0_g2_i3.p2 TRINITY_DN11601_c0_g2~~TRINITY_DN11601_c0_g2_i3.p2  ORF type:complete len:102 (+),score=19.23 TRINITY_DN11601_c0_g2_i3:1169-1474(+)
MWHFVHLHENLPWKSDRNLIFTEDVWYAPSIPSYGLRICDEEFFVWGEDFQKYLMENMSKLSSKFDPDFQIISNVKLEIGEFQCPTTSFPCDPVTFESLSL